MPNSKNPNSMKCSECKGLPSQHNIRDASIEVNGKSYRQHAFKAA